MSLVVMRCQPLRQALTPHTILHINTNVSMSHQGCGRHISNFQLFIKHVALYNLSHIFKP
ncbi:hypothetical protein E2J99_18270 [Vibrio cholerae]|nr:hypothetical protein [Vibrio cholerae]